MIHNTIDTNATKVFLPQKIQPIVSHILSFANIHYGYAGNESGLQEVDFILFTEETIAQTQDIRCNIAFIPSDEQEKYNTIAIESGGILIVPEESLLEYQKNNDEETFKRVLSYPIKEFETHFESIQIQTELGAISLSVEYSSIAKDFEGIQLLVSQIGVYDDDFFEAFFSL